MLEFFEMTQEEYDNLNPPILDCLYDEETEKYFIELLGDDPAWIPVGYIPKPKSRLGWFMYHLVHGLAMKYPFHKVVYFSITNTNP